MTDSITYTIYGGLIVGLVILLFKNRLSVEREQENRFFAANKERDAAQKQRDAIVSDFVRVIDKWLERINNERENRLENIRADSLKEIEGEILKVQAILDAAAKDGLDKQWEKYQRIGKDDVQFFKGVEQFDAATSRASLSYPARQALSEPLERMKEIVQDAQNKKV